MEHFAIWSTHVPDGQWIGFDIGQNPANNRQFIFSGLDFSTQ